MGALLDLLRPPRLRTYSVRTTAMAEEPVRWRYDNGSKFYGGFGPTELLIPDYWTLRQRSADLFQRNIYARGLIRRLVTNEINTGLHLEATPEERILGKKEDDLADWSEDVENRFKLWERNPTICHQKETQTFGQLQAEARREALVAGDVLVVLRQDQRTKLPRLELISADAVQTPFGRVPKGVKIVEGVELDVNGRHVAYHVRQDDRTSKRLPAYGEKSGRRIAWLMYGTDKRLSDVRGTPLLGIILQSLKELDRYRDATIRKAVVNAIYALIVKKTQDKPGTRPITGGAQRRGSVTVKDTSEAPRRFQIAEQIPGAVVEELQVGEEPVPHQSGTDPNYGPFEDAVVQAIAWCNNVPPEILTLAFSSNYSASQAAINEFKIYLNLVRTDFGEQFCQPVYVEWLLASSLAGKIDAPGLVEAFRNYAQHDTWGAWVSADWSGNIKPAVDMSKLVKGYEAMVANGFITRDRATRELTGMKHSKVVKRLKIENPELLIANRPMAELEAITKSSRGGDPSASDAPPPADDPSKDDVEEPEADADASTEERPN